MANDYGLVVEGDYDSGVFEELIRKVNPAAEEIVVRPCGGRQNLTRLFSTFLRDFEHVLGGRPVTRVLVISDADGRDQLQAEQSLAARIAQHEFRFPVEFFSVRQQMDAILLADTLAINTVAQMRDATGHTLRPIQEDIEEILRPKERLRAELSKRGLPYDPLVCREIARHASLENLCYKLRTFHRFVEKVRV